jgi:hypothetical protein
LQVTPSENEPGAASTHADSPTPRYVLDRISGTPANYDVPNVQF